MSDLPFELYNEECLHAMSFLPPKSVDMVLCDLPYGTTQNKWDSIIPLEPLWAEYQRICKGAIVLTAAQPFTSALVMSNISGFSYSLVWDKIGTTGFQSAGVRPLRRHEDVVVFHSKLGAYNPQKITRGKPRKKGGSKIDNGCYGSLRSTESFNNEYHPTSIIEVSNASKKGLVHPTQKPVKLMEYLIRTYSNLGDTVLDNTMGSGTTGVACMNTGRKFIGMEKDVEHGYFQIAEQRIKLAWELNDM